MHALCNLAGLTYSVVLVFPDEEREESSHSIGIVGYFAFPNTRMDVAIVADQIVRSVAASPQFRLTGLLKYVNRLKAM